MNMKQQLPILEILVKDDDRIRVQANDLLNAAGTIYVNDRRARNSTPLVWCNESNVILFHPDFEWKFGINETTGQAVAVALAKPERANANSTQEQ
jgi:hypothetical protein